MNVPVPDYVPDFRPTHVVPRDGLSAWEAPDPGLPTAPLDAFLPVRLTERAGDWGRVLCSNGWSAWVDARLLVAVPNDPPAAGRPLTRTADPRPLIARAEDALGRYRRAAEELGAGRLDGEAFRLRTRGLRVGMVVDGESVWLYDAEHERWVFCDGLGLITYAAAAAPSAAARPAGTPLADTPAGTPPGTPAGTAPDGEPPSADGHRPGTKEVPASVGAAGAAGAGKAGDEAPGAPPGYEPTQVVPKADPAVAAGPPPTQIVERPPDETDEG
ncbi:hypothetical protein [Streptomyces sp. NPDC052494]|uniref:hypothetical protein n=1 Tax=Streptomyces sp. NPDC052494 TaxID=3365692 RepID=UPI0037CF3525